MSVSYNRLCELVPAGKVRQKEPMSRHTTFRAGGFAAYYVEPDQAGELAAVIGCCRETKTPYYILGGGSNLLVGDRGYDGVIISLVKFRDNIAADSRFIYAGAGVKLSRLARAALEASLTGLEFAAGIPGTVGGAVVMNAGAYGSEIKDVLNRAEVWIPDGTYRFLNSEELQLGYRTSCVDLCGYVVTSAIFELEPGDQALISCRMAELAAARKEKQPLEYPSAGSTFKRPEGHFAGKLIEDAGLAGFRIGDAQVSEKHCGFIINRGRATASDIIQVCQTVQSRVKERFGVSLELELKTLGEF